MVRMSSGCRDSSSSVIHSEVTVVSARISWLRAFVDAVSIDLLLRVEVEPALIGSNLTARDTEAQHRAEQVQGRVHPHVRIASLPVDCSDNCIAHAQIRRLHFRNMHNPALLTLTRIDDSY